MQRTVQFFMQFPQRKVLQSAAVPFGLARFPVEQRPFAILVTAQRLLNHHAQASPLHGISIRIPSVLTALPNFNGQLFWYCIRKSRLLHYESILQGTGVVVPEGSSAAGSVRLQTRETISPRVMPSKFPRY